MYDRAQDLAVALDLNGQGFLDSCRRIHRPAQLLGDAPERVAQLFLVGVGHGEKAVFVELGFALLEGSR